MLLRDRKYCCSSVNLWKGMDGSVPKCSAQSRDGPSLFTSITSTGCCGSKGFRCWLDEDLNHVSSEVPSLLRRFSAWPLGAAATSVTEADLA